jgi:hypothetical protein
MIAAVRRASAILLACALGAFGAGCGEGGGVSSGATVSAYVVAPLCEGAKMELARAGGRAGDLRVRAVCLANARSGDGLSLARIGANARRATEDSTAVAYLEPPDPAANRFSRPILESAGIASIASNSGAAAMTRLLRAIREAGGSGSLREAVRSQQVP